MKYLKLFAAIWLLVYVFYFIFAFSVGALTESATMSWAFMTFMYLPLMTTMIAGPVTLLAAIVMALANKKPSKRASSDRENGGKI